MIWSFIVYHNRHGSLSEGKSFIELSKMISFYRLRTTFYPPHYNALREQGQNSHYS